MNDDAVSFTIAAYNLPLTAFLLRNLLERQRAHQRYGCESTFLRYRESLPALREDIPLRRSRLPQIVARDGPVIATLIGKRRGAARHRLTTDF